MIYRLALLVVALCGVCAWAAPTSAPSKPIIAFFPLGGTVKEDLRAKVGFSLRTKLDRAGNYEVIDGLKMAEVAAEAKEPISFETAPDAVRELGKLVDADVLVWGEVINADGGTTVRMKVLDLREPKPSPRPISQVMKQPTDLRFISEEILQTLPGVATFEHPNEEAVTHDATADELWKTNPNLVVNGDFSADGHWEALFEAQRYAVKISQSLPPTDKVCIYSYREPDQMTKDGRCIPGIEQKVLAMKLSRYCAENNGMACLSESIKIEPDTRYRLSFRYKSDGPTLHVFIKGYTMIENIKGEKVEREVYRRQVPVTGKTDGWATIVDELNPQHVAFPVQTLRVDLYAYLSPGTVMFDDVVIKAVGKQTRKAKDDAIRAPVSRPAGKK